MEMMHHEAGVRAVAVGGLPLYGPMQAPSGSRGALYYTSDEVDDNINFTAINNVTTAALFPNRQNDVYITNLGVNLRDQVRRGENVPLQFVYEAADCRTFFTPQTIYNYTNLWQYAADATWSDPTLCVANSTGYATYNTTDTKGTPPTATAQNAQSPIDLSRYLDLNPDTQTLATDATNGLPDQSAPIVVATQRFTLKPDSRIPSKYRVRKGRYKGACSRGSPRCGGSRTGPVNPKNTLPPDLLPVSEPGVSPEPASPSPDANPDPSPETIPETSPETSPEVSMSDLIVKGFVP